MRDKPDPPRKRCIVCGRPMTWRRKWALSWHGVKFCSDRCRKQHRQGRPEQGRA